MFFSIFRGHLDFVVSSSIAFYLSRANVLLFSIFGVLLGSTFNWCMASYSSSPGMSLGLQANTSTYHLNMSMSSLLMTYSKPVSMLTLLSGSPGTILIFSILIAGVISSLPSLMRHLLKLESILGRSSKWGHVLR